MNFLESVGTFAIVLLVAVLFSYLFKDVKSFMGRRLVGLLSIVAVVFLITQGEKLFSSFAPTQTPTSRPLPTITPSVAAVSRTVQTQPPKCFKWSQVTSSMDGRRICVYGVVQSIYSTSETWTRIRFTSEPNNFFLFSSQYTFEDLGVGSCVMAQGRVELYDRIPFIDVGDELYYCEDWMQ